MTQPCYTRTFDQFSWEWSKFQNARLKKNLVFQNRQFSIFFQKKNCFASSPWKLIKSSWVARLGQNFDDYPDFQPKVTHTKHFWPGCIVPSYIGKRIKRLVIYLEYWMEILRSEFLPALHHNEHQRKKNVFFLQFHTFFGCLFWPLYTI